MSKSELEKSQDLGADAESTGSTVPFFKSRMFASTIPTLVGIVLACVLFLTVLFFNYFNGLSDGVVFNSTIGQTSDFFYFEITPAGWAFSIWGLIYVMQFTFLLYAVISIFRKTAGVPLYAVPVVPMPVYYFYALNQLVNIAWLFAFDRKIIILSGFFLAAIPATIIACMAWSFWYKSHLVSTFKTNGQRYEMILVNIFVYNAWAVYLGWTVCATLLNFGFVLVYSGGVTQEAAGMTALTILFFMLLVFPILEVTILDKYLRYVVMHYLGPLLALSGSYDKGGSNNKGVIPSGVNRTYAAIVLGFLLLMLVLKLVNLGVRCWKQPLYYDNGCTDKSAQSDSREHVMNEKSGSQVLA